MKQKKMSYQNLTILLMKNEICDPSIDESMRQTGRTTRIISHVIEQLFNHGECIVADHVAYEFKDRMTLKVLNYFIERVERAVEDRSRSSKNRVVSKVVTVNGIKMVHFKLQYDGIPKS